MKLDPKEKWSCLWIREASKILGYPFCVAWVYDVS